MAIEYGLVPNESCESLYSEICLSHNQVKQMLNHYLNSIRNMTIQLNEETLIKLKGTDDHGHRIWSSTK